MSSSGSITGSIPTGIYGLAGPGLPFAFLAFILTFVIVSIIALIVIRVTNPTFLRNVQDTQGNYVSVSWWRSLWVSWVIALIPALLVAALTFYLTARVGKAVAGVGEKVLPYAVQLAPLVL